MAKIVLGIGTSHGPMLSTPPDQWGQRVEADRRNPAHWFKGKPYTFEAAGDAARARASRTPDHPAALERAACRVSARHRQARGCLRRGEARRRGDRRQRPDGDVQGSAYPGDERLSRRDHSQRLSRARKRSRKCRRAFRSRFRVTSRPQGATYPGLPDLAQHIIETAIADQFDVDLDGMAAARRRSHSARFRLRLRQIMARQAGADGAGGAQHLLSAEPADRCRAATISASRCCARSSAGRATHASR